MCVQDLKARGTPFPVLGSHILAIVPWGLNAGGGACSRCIYHGGRQCSSDLREISVSSAEKGSAGSRVLNRRVPTARFLCFQASESSLRMRPSGRELPAKLLDFDQGSFLLTVFTCTYCPFTGLPAVPNGLLCGWFREGDSGSHHSCNTPTTRQDWTPGGRPSPPMLQFVIYTSQSHFRLGKVMVKITGDKAHKKNLSSHSSY